jgi:hypothetical protein
MVAKIKSGKSLIGALNYNENKVRNHQAQLIEASGYFKDLGDLSFNDKLLRLTDLALRNENTKTNTVHISLNFAIGENLENEKIQQIIADYMDQIGFGDQPYLGYKHTDAGHPHAHIVTTNIQKTGERISLHLLGKTKSEQARKDLEVKYGLQKAGEQIGEKKTVEKMKAVKVEYGKTDTKRAITNVVNEIIKTYKVTSIPEFNAVLKRYNVVADRGAKDSRMFEKKGLVYWTLDEKGNKIGVPIKASSIYGKPTLHNLESRFRLNEVLRKPVRQQLKDKIDRVIKESLTKGQFQQKLFKLGVQVIYRQNLEGRLYGITFLDYQSKAVFNGSDLGKEYSAALLQARFIKSSQKETSANFNHAQYDPTAGNQPRNGDSLLEILYKEEQQDMAALGKLQQRKRRKKRKGNSL